MFYWHKYTGKGCFLTCIHISLRNDRCGNSLTTAISDCLGDDSLIVKHYTNMHFLLYYTSSLSRLDNYYYFVSAAVAVIPATWLRHHPLRGVDSVCLQIRWPQSQEGDWARPHLCKLARQVNGPCSPEMVHQRSRTDNNTNLHFLLGYTLSSLARKRCRLTSRDGRPSSRYVAVTLSYLFSVNESSMSRRVYPMVTITSVTDTQ